MPKEIYDQILSLKQKDGKAFAMLLDPDEVDLNGLARLAELASDCGVDYFLVGGSLVTSDRLEKLILGLKAASSIPVVLFPGSLNQLSPSADALLFLSLISGRNPDLLIGQQVLAAPYVVKSGIEVLPTGYMLIDGGAPTTVSYISNTLPIPRDKEDIAMCTAMAGQLLGLRLIYMDAGSGARYPISPKMISEVSAAISLPLIIGGGIRTPEEAAAAAEAGAQVIVIGNALEKSPELAREMSIAIHSVKSTSKAFD